MTRTLRLFVVGLLVLAAVPALAQDRQGGRRGGGFGRGGAGGGIGAVQLVGIEQVQKELELVDDQKSEITKITDESRQGLGDLFGGLRDLPDEERQAKMREMQEKLAARNKETEEKINKVLLDHQKKRLKEITLQVQGIAALSNADVVTALALTSDQKDQIKKVTDDADQARRDLFQNAGDGDRAALREKGQTIRQEAEQKALAVLTADQKTKFEDMKGKKFEIDPAALRGGRGGFGGGGGRRGGNQ
jgi:Spy/CpxP family protein refolding chaperone